MRLDWKVTDGEMSFVRELRDELINSSLEKIAAPSITLLIVLENDG